MARIYVEKDQDVFLYYNKFCTFKPLPTPDEAFYPFFFYDGTRPCVLSKYFLKHYNCSIGTYENFLQILNDKNQFKREVVFYFLQEYREKIDIEKVIVKDPVEVTKSVIELHSHGTYTNTFVRLFYDFDLLVDELSEYLNKMFLKLAHFHENQKQAVKEAIDGFLKPETINVYTKKVGLPKSIKVTDQTFSVSLINPSALIWFHEKNEYFYILTVGSYKSILKVTLDVLETSFYSNVTKYSLAKIFSNDIICDILRELTKKDLTITMLSQKLHISRTTVDRFVSGLNDEFAITVSRSVGKEKYYDINPEFFLIAKAKFDDMFDEFMSKWRC